MLGAIFGDIVGSTYEFKNIFTTEFELFEDNKFFTDDTVLTIATAYSILNNIPFEESYKTFGLKYFTCGYGGSFRDWLMTPEPKPYSSWGNGSAMRVSPIGWSFDSLFETMLAAEQTALCTHNHIEGIKGATAIAGAIYLARTTNSKVKINEFIQNILGYDIDSIDLLKFKEFNEHRKETNERFDVSCQGCVPIVLKVFNQTHNFEKAIRLMVSLGGDTDTLCAILGSLCEAYYGLEDILKSKIIKYLPQEFIEITDKFYDKFIKSY